MKKVVFTICSANHLAQAITLGNSLLENNDDYNLVIGLVDIIDNRFIIDEQLSKFEIIEAKDLAIPSFIEMTQNYNIIELNCALKPFYAVHIIEKYTLDKIIYLDSDIYLYNSIKNIELLLDTCSIIITPHFTNTLAEDGKKPLERDILKSGLYNGGFFALKCNNDSLEFLNWWKEKLKTQCYYNFSEGMGVDQVWLDFVPLFFKNVLIFNNKGYNVAYWNLHERSITKVNNNFVVNNMDPLIFFHISGFDINNPKQISKHQDRFLLEDNSTLSEIFENYYQKLIKNKHEYYSQFGCYYVKPKKKKNLLFIFINNIIRASGYSIVKN